MRPSQFAVLASLALTRPVSAGFYIYAINILNNIGEINFDGYTFYTGPPACSDGGIVTLPALDDVSGSKGGVRCEGCSSAYAEKEPEPTELEWNNGDGSHYTWYLNRDGALVDLDGNVAGKCNKDSSDDFNCLDSSTGTIRGQSQLWCDTDVEV